MKAYVLVELSIKSIDHVFSYIVPSHLEDSIEVGKRVYVPFNSKQLEGFVVKLHDEESEYELKEIIRVIDEEPVLNAEMIQLGKWLSKKTMSHLISSFQVMLPKALKAKSGKKDSIRYETVYAIGESEISVLKTEKQRDCFEYVLESGQISRKDLLEYFSTSIIKTLVDKGCLSVLKVESYRYQNNVIKRDQKKELTEKQGLVYKQLQYDEINTYVLHGVTGSGKTEVYMHWIDDVIKKGKEAIMLVPEISLTPQMVGRFVARFGDSVAVLHSGLNSAEKYDEWRKIQRKEVDIVIGARSAIFAPFENLGIIIIDEEHELSYKQDNHPKYHAHDVATWRSHYHKCPLVLGSATPSIETYSQTMGDFKLLELDERVNKQPLPFVHLVNMVNERDYDGVPIFSERLLDLIEDRLNKEEQVVLLLNRRGYTRVYTCAKCGEVKTCPNCDISLTYHKNRHVLKCHYCDYQTSANTRCDDCGHNEFIDYGYGTEKVEEQLYKHFPSAKVVRMDSDTTQRKGAHQRILDGFKNKEYSILLGTQMIAKGLDFEDVTLVGVINADTALNLPDYRSSELTFQLLSQVSGRAGRHKRMGEVVIQSMNIEHYSILYAKIHDYKGFFEHELDVRKRIGYPPFYRLVKITIRSQDYKMASKESSKVASYFKRYQSDHLKVLGPTPANILRINNVYRFGCILKYRSFNELIPLLKNIKEMYATNHKVTVDFDINPSRML